MSKILLIPKKHLCTSALVLVLAMTAALSSWAQGIGVELVQNGQFSVYPGTTAAASGSTPKATYTISAGTSLGAWRSDRVYATTNADPTTRGQVSGQFNNTSYVTSPTNTSLTPSNIVQRTYSDFNPPSASNPVTSTTTLSTFLLYRGDGSGAAGGSIWIQNMSVLPNTTYTVSYWASNAAPVGSTATTAVVPPQLVMAGTQLAGGSSTPLVLTPAAGQVQAIPFEATTDIWTKYTYTFTTTGAAGVATNVELRLNDVATAATLLANDDEVAITNISVRATSATAGTAFDCNNAAFYQMRQTANAAINGVSGSSSRLFTVNRATSPYTTTQTLELGATLNSMGYEPNNAYLYALTYTGNTSGSVNSGASGRESQPSALVELVKIGATGAESLGFITDLPVKQWAGGTIDRNFNLYLKTQDYDNAIYRVNLNATPISAATLTTSAYFVSYDLVYDPTATGTGSAATNLLYGVSFPGKVASNGILQNAALFSLNTSTNPVTVTNIGSPLVANGNYNSAQLDTNQPLGTAFFDVSGTLYAYGNGPTGNSATTDGKFYTIDKGTGLASTVNTINGATNSDGASCINPSQQIDVVTQLTGVALVPGNVNQRDMTYTLYLRNTATTTDANVQVSDFLWGSSTNVAFPTATAGVLQGIVSVTNQDGSNLSANAAFTGQGTAVGAPSATSPALAALLNTSIPQVLTAGQRAQISFTVRLTFPSGAVPSATQYNTVLASNTSSGNTGYTQLTTGALLPPINLNANDASTNGSTFAALRSTGTIDTPVPTPSTFQPAIYGNVFEDVNYGGGSGRSLLASVGVSRNGVRVELYQGSGSTATLASTTTTDASGNYSFIDLTAGNTYTVRAVNNFTNAVSSSRAGAEATLRGVQTWRYNDGNRVGGESPASVDGANVTTIGAALSSANAAASGTTPATTAQNIVAITLPATTATATTSVDFGFNFDTVVNTNDMGQGSLRQFLTNANALGGEASLTQSGIRTDSTGTSVSLPIGKETSIFMISDGDAHPGLTAYDATTNPGLASQLTNSVVLLTATSTLTLGGTNGQNTNLDGSTQFANVGTNPGGAFNAAATTVGTNALALSAVRRAAVEIQAAGVTTLLDVEAAKSTVRSLALHSADGDNNAVNNQVVLVGNMAPATNYLFESVLVGANADGLRPSMNRSNGYGINLKGNSGSGTVVHSLLAFNGQSGLNINNGTGTTGINQFTNNFLLQNGFLTGGGDGMTFGDGGGSGPANVTKNSFRNQNSSGIQFEIGSTSATTVTNNSIFAGGIIGTDGAGSSLEGSGIDYILRSANLRGSQADVIKNNVITGSRTGGIVVGYGQQNVTMTQNSTYDNAGLGIDLVATSSYYVNGGNPLYGDGDNVTVNDGNDPATAGPDLPNKGVDFPVLATAKVDNANLLTVTGYSRPGAVVEFFIRDTDATGFGEGQTYLVTRTEGTAQDLDGSTGSYGFPVVASVPTSVNGLNQGSDANASKFTFTFSLTAAQRSALLLNGLTATATLSTSTSEFSGKVTVTAAPLPVSLTVFTAQAVRDQDGLLKWTTATETDNDHFDVERSFDGRSFVKIGQVAGQGTKLTSTDYTLTDAGVAAKATGLVYYRLRQVDRDGTATYSPVRTISFTSTAGSIGLYPTLTNGATTLDLRQLPAANTYHVLLTDMTGRAVRTWEMTGGQLQTLDVTDAAQGIYHVRVTGQQPDGSALSQSQRLTKQ